MSTLLPGPLAADASLHLLADHLLAARLDGQVLPSALHVVLDDDGFQLGVADLDDVHPGDAWLGVHAPAHWHAVGVATGGWARDSSPEAEARRLHPANRGVDDRARVEVVTLVTRSGEVIHRMADARGEAIPVDGVPEGTQVDALRRALGLPTPPPPGHVAAYWASVWLAAIVDPGRPAPADLAEALARHPALRLLERGDADVAADAVDVLRAFHRVVGWSRLRLLCRQGAFVALGIDVDLADWHDDGSFARAVLSRTSPASHLRQRLALHVQPALRDAVLDLLAATGAPEHPWPDGRLR